MSRIDQGESSGMFHPMERKPYPAYYGFLAFSELYCRKNQVEIQVEIPGVYVCAAKSETGCLVIANTNEEEIEVTIEVRNGNEIEKCVEVSENGIWKECEFSNKLLKHSILCIYYK